MGIKPSDKNGIEPLHSPLNSIRNAQWILSSGESVRTCFAVFLRSASLRGVGELQMSNCGCFSTCARCSIMKNQIWNILWPWVESNHRSHLSVLLCVIITKFSHIYRCRHSRPCVGLLSHLFFLLLSLLVGLKSPWWVYRPLNTFCCYGCWNLCYRISHAVVGIRSCALGVQ